MRLSSVTRFWFAQIQRPRGRQRSAFRYSRSSFVGSQGTMPEFKFCARPAFATFFIAQ